MKRALLLLVATVGLAGCRLAGVPPSDTSSLTDVASLSALASPSPSAGAEVLEAPEACGFPDGAALEFAGRSTYAELRVGDAVGDSVDPMSDDPADIYITRDTFNQGSLHGRLVCAIFVDTPGFVEITVHPEDWGRFTPAPEPGVPAGGLTADEAIEAARAALPAGEEWYVELNGSGPIGTFLSPESREEDWEGELAEDRWAWAVSARRTGEGVAMFIDFVDGTVVARIAYPLDQCGRHPSDSEYGTDPCPDL